MSKGGIIAVTIICTLIVLLLGVVIYFTCVPSGVAAWNNWHPNVQDADDRTNYETLKQVEDTCRAMIASYNSDKLTYQQYKDSDKTNEQEWAAQAKMRANTTASTYNNYIIKNKHVWKDAVPDDIYTTLEYIE